MARAAIYAMIQLGCRKIFLHNRTIENAEKVATHFNSWAAGLSSDGQVVRVLTSNKVPWPSGFNFPTMIISCVPAISVGGEAPANFEMPTQWLGSSTGGVVVDVSLSLSAFDCPLTSLRYRTFHSTHRFCDKFAGSVRPPSRLGLSWMDSRSCRSRL